MSEEDKDNKEKARENMAELRGAISTLTMTFEQSVELYKVVGKLYKAKFDAFVAAGFSAEQALEIVKARGLGN
jgi:hypothetical protein